MEKIEMTEDDIFSYAVGYFLFFCLNLYLAKKNKRSLGWTMLGSIFIPPLITVFLLIPKKVVSDESSSSLSNTQKLLKNYYLRFLFLLILGIIGNQIVRLTPDKLNYFVPLYLTFISFLSFPKTRKIICYSIIVIGVMISIGELSISYSITSEEMNNWWVKGPFVLIGTCVWFIYMSLKAKKSDELGEENYFTQAKLTKEDLKFLKTILIVVSIIGLITAIFLFINENIDQLIHISLIAGIPLGALLCAIGSESLGEKDDRFKTGHKENFEPMVWVTLICFIIGIPWFIAGVVYTLSSGIL
jgi:hypothetical protein